MIMREIKFKGLRIDGHGWHYGDLNQNCIDTNLRYCVGIKQGKNAPHEVIPETVGQYTGLTDKNNVEIYEGDIVRILYTDWGSKSDSDSRTLEQYLIDISKTGVVEFNDNAWEIKMYSKKYDDYYHGSISCGIHGRIEVIGNIHENPELLCTSQSS